MEEEHDGPFSKENSVGVLHLLLIKHTKLHQKNDFYLT